MPRESTQRLTPRAVPQSAPPQAVNAKAAATATDALPAYIPQQRDPTLQGLLEGLSSISPVIMKKLQEVKEDEAGKAVTEAEAGMEPTSDSANYTYHFRGTRGDVDGQQDRSSIWTAYHTEFDKDGGDLEKFLADKYKAQTNGLQDGPYLRNYNKQIAGGMDDIRKEHLTLQRKKVEARVESDAMHLIDNVVGAFVRNDTPIPEDYLENLEKTTGKNLGVSQQRFQELLFETVRKNAEDGHFEAFELLKKPRTDGSPGLYYDPKWIDKIESAQDAAYAKAEAQGKKVREERQDTALYSVFDKLYSGDSAGAKAEYDGLVKQGLFTHASDRIKWEGEFTKAQNKEARMDQQAAELELQAGIYRGSTGIREVIKADLTAPQKRSLLSEIHKVKQDVRMVAATAAQQEKAIFKSPEFRSGEEYIKGVLASVASPTDILGTGSLFERQQRASAILEFTQAAQRAQSPADLIQAREEITSRYLKRRTELKATANATAGAGLIRYSTPDEVAKAGREGKLTPEEVSMHLNFFKARNTNAR